MGLALAAGILALTVVVHSILGERLIFGRICRTAPNLPMRQLRILRASWHLVSVCGLTFAFQLLLLGDSAVASLSQTIAAALLVSALIVFAFTRARHPGWVALLLAGLLTLLS